MGTTTHTTSAQQSEKPAPPRLHTLLNLDEIEAAAKSQVSKKCWSYYFSAADDLYTKAHNTQAFRDILLRPRVFVDCTKADTSTTLLGSHKVGIPLYVSPAALARLAHPDGEAGIAKGISSFGAMQLVSNNASMTPEQIVAEAKPSSIFGWQLYVQTNRSKSEAMLARINKLRDHFKCIVLTLDAPHPGKREHDEKSNLEAAGELVESASNAKTDAEKKPGGGGVGQQLFWGTAADLTWETTLPWLAKHTDLPIVLKGIQTHEDAYLAAQYARKNPGTVKAVILSNHGGRALDTAPPAVHTLLEIRKYCPEVFGAVEVWIDGGIKRGTDVVKALCLGAKAVGVGRAALWGLGAGGWQGVERTFESKWLFFSRVLRPVMILCFWCFTRDGYADILRTTQTVLQQEIITCMKLLGAKTIDDLGPRFVSLPLFSFALAYSYVLPCGPRSPFQWKLDLLCHQQSHVIFP